MLKKPLTLRQCELVAAVLADLKAGKITVAAEKGNLIK